MNLPVSLQKMILNRKDALTYQYILVCRPLLKRTSAVGTEHLNTVSAVDLRRCHLNSLNQRIAELEIELSEAKSCAEAFQNKSAKLNIQLVDVNDELMKEKHLAGEYARRISDLQNHSDQLDKAVKHYQSIIHRIEQNPFYRVYRKLKDAYLR